MSNRKWGMRLAHCASALAFVSVMLLPSATYAAGGKAVILPDLPTVAEGASQTFTVSLTQPIIILDTNRSYVHLNITSSDPSRVSVTPNPVEYLPSDWWQQRTFTVTVLANATYGDGGTITMTATIDSGAPYYDAYVVNFPLVIADMTAAPAATPSAQVASVTTTTATPRLVDTGLDLAAPSLFAFFTLTSALVIRLLPRRRHA